ncbi:MAG: serine/threonine-protein kinase [Planctomycetota bacterium]
MPGQRIGIYVLQRQIGRGGMGAVWLAHDPSLDRPVAIKMLPPELAADPDYLARFRREATTLAGIRHPNLMHIYAVGCEGGRHFIAMEYIKGRSLARILRKQGALSWQTAVRVLGQVLAALDQVHGAGVVHRDLKSGNIMIDEDRRAILMDFGLAKPRHDRSVTTGHTILGTPEYMAPELAEGAEATFASDLYALGVVLHEMLTGQVPFRGPSAIATLRQQVESPVPGLTGVVADLPEPLDAVLTTAMAKNPADRYPTPRACAADLAGLRRTPELVRLARGAESTSTPRTLPIATPTTPTQPTQPAEAPPPPATGKRRSPWLVPALAGGALAAVVLTVALGVRLFGGAGADSAEPGQAAAAVGAPPPGNGVAAAGTAVEPVAPTTEVAPGPPPSAGRYRILVRPDSEVTGRIVSIDDEWVRVATGDGSVERIAYGSVLRIEKLGGR